MRVQVSLALALLGAALAGCVSPEIIDPNSTPLAGDGALPRPLPQAVVAVIDTGINPYHVDFRDNSTLAYQHPSTYLPGYPADAVAVNLTFNATDLDAALAADKAVWESLKPRTLYWFPGTKIVGAYSVQDTNVIFDVGHGHMTASRAGGNAYSLCPMCRVAMVQGFTGEAVTWASEQPWIDAQSNSWSPLVVFQQADNLPLVSEPGLADAFELAATKHAVFGSAGNGVAGKGGALGHPSFTRSTSGPTGVVSVGGHDNGDVILWSGSWPHVVADACSNWAAVGNSLEDYSPREGGGTSSASPYAAGAAARLIYEARVLLQDPYTTGVANASFVKVDPATALLSVNETSPLADGDLTLAELKEVLMKTATARPVETEHDGENCGMTGAPYNTYPIAWDQIPANVPSYHLIGYGQISVDSVALGLSVLRGEVPMPDRAFEDEQHGVAETIRETYNGLPR